MADFDGRSALLYRFKQKSVSTAKDVISLRFKSRQADGVLLHGESRRGHFITLELRDTRLALHLNLDDTSGGGEAVTVGSLLDDEKWHWVAMERLNKQVKVSVDHYTQSFQTQGHGESLEVDYELSFGGIPLPGKPGTFLRRNFEGCMENVYYNGVNVIDLAKRRKPQMYSVGNVSFSCTRPERTACTFISSSSSLLWLPAAPHTIVDRRYFSIRFQFRTWNTDALLLVTGLGPMHRELRLHISDSRLLLGNAATVTSRNTGERGPRVNDGLWHWLSLDYRGLQLVLSLDHQPIATVRQLHPLEPSGGFFFGGCGASDCHSWSSSFQGCMRLLSIDRWPIKLSLVQQGMLGNFSSLLFDACHIRDRCLPNMCEHGTSCTQTWDRFNCNCSGSGYAGATCHHSIFESSCESYRLSGGSSGFYSIDPDGSGPLGPTQVYCNMTDDKVWTLISHNVTLPVRVSDSSKHETHVMKFNSSASSQQLRAIVMASEQCRQEVVFTSKRSRLLKADEGHPLSWWVDQHGERRNYWGSSSHAWSKDSGFLSGKEHLPLSVLVEDSEAVHSVGPLRCHGDKRLWNMASFNQEGAYLSLPPLQPEQAFDLTFYFKTDGPSGVFLNSLGQKDFIRLELSSPSVMMLSFSASVVLVKSHLPLNDRQWHYVRVERNVKETLLQVDELPVGVLEAPPDAAVHQRLGGQLFVGGVPSGLRGFLGCIRSLTVNGLTYDLQESAKTAPGVSPTCPGYCDGPSVVCHNRGRCFEKSDGFACDCSRSAYAGPLCKDEVALAFDEETSVTYTFLPGHHQKSSVSKHGGGRTREDMTFSFVTMRRPAMLLSVKTFKTYYMVVLLAGNGRLHVWYNLQSDRKPEVFSPASSSLADGRSHQVRILCESNTVYVQVDQQIDRKFTLVSDAEPIPIMTVTLGKITINESLPLEVVSAGKAGFVGCLSAVHVNHVAPLKVALLQRGISSVGVRSALAQSRCSDVSHDLTDQHHHGKQRWQSKGGRDNHRQRHSTRSYRRMPGCCYDPPALPLPPPKLAGSGL
ncbi:contactin-associated protein-like 5 isoform X1 [Entelurus aequoreus]|uniref:contactin-associated protein-like 5 isoform X1 n=1 Tax=Entelurus aequoreus TaxID=161455 RepID=UPI002B1D531F|nr:contactin-associated protein-like 5 isoform X1 [Entelurus aequoreus]